MEAQNLAEVGIEGSADEAASRLADLTESCGLAGVVCSALEAPRLRRERRPGFLLVTPGIRPSSAISDDQRRVATRLALKAGRATCVSRPITRAPIRWRTARDPSEMGVTWLIHSTN
jgi:orotidine-5'-phosphate decarboxylase